MKSIMHDRKDGTCYLCMKLRGDYSRKGVLQEHHAICGTANRRKSEEYGLKVYLCPQHHINGLGPEAVHGNDRIRRYVEVAAQAAFERSFPDRDFKEVFGKYASWEQEPEEKAGRQQAHGEGLRQQAHEKESLKQEDGFAVIGDALPLPDCLRE